MIPNPNEFWPTSLVGWITVFGMVGTIAGLVWSFAQTMARLNGLGDRLNNHIIEANEKHGALDGRLSAAESALILSQADRSNLHESIGRITTEMQTLLKIAQTTQLQRAEDLGEIKERLVRIETKVDHGKNNTP